MRYILQVAEKCREEEIFPFFGRAADFCAPCIVFRRAEKLSAVAEQRKGGGHMKEKNQNKEQNTNQNQEQNQNTNQR